MLREADKDLYGHQVMNKEVERIVGSDDPLH